jgi:DNA (cytosine-5)-methyltransferase 1
MQFKDGLGPHSLKLIDLFSGCGGFTLGFTSVKTHGKRQLFQPVWANDNNLDAVTTYNENFEHRCTAGDIVNILRHRKNDIPQAEIVIGGPPCQGYSLLNKNREADTRKQLWRPFLQVVAHSKAKIFVIENVPQLLGSAEFEELRTDAQRMGFVVREKTLRAADYGVAQTRNRAFVIGVLDHDPINAFPPRKTHYSRDKTEQLAAVFNQYIDSPAPWVTVRDAVGDLGEPEGTSIRAEAPPLDLHFGRNPTPVSVERYRTIPEEGANRIDLEKRRPDITPPCWLRKKSGGTDLFGRLWWDRPAYTIRTEFFKPEKGRYLHPEQHRRLASSPSPMGSVSREAKLKLHARSETLCHHV